MVDVRSETEFGICKIAGSFSAFHSLPGRKEELTNRADLPFAKLLRDPKAALGGEEGETVFVCRRGNDSILAARALRRALATVEGEVGEAVVVRDLVGGLEAWGRDVDPEFPLY